ncbi:hypothetical protein FTUN_0324 [Frigoriglobus tundricola]|uniref:Uncharacterized protein n=1 Tax=Frigoriglobus tundricola TaxID=2774151 RepID=A0A6M5YFP3_9BACT|nr:hypothetical protein FTUN_0324 [Frigoriglobus tundricola]
MKESLAEIIRAAGPGGRYKLLCDPSTRWTLQAVAGNSAPGTRSPRGRYGVVSRSPFHPVSGFRLIVPPARVDRGPAGAADLPPPAP